MTEADLAMPDSPVAPPSIYDRLHGKAAHVPVTLLLIGANLLVFGLMLGNGAGLWHAQNSIQLAWGANFGPATQDGQWWRLGSALFLHFGLIHLTMNLWALWDGGQLVERMFGHLRFIIIYLASGLCGNLLSLVIQGNEAVSGGASGAIFGVYGALLVFVWRERQQLNPGEFRWLFWGGLGFSAVSITLGLVIPGIDNSAHIGGLIAGCLLGMLFGRAQVLVARTRTRALVVVASGQRRGLDAQIHRTRLGGLVEGEFAGRIGRVHTGADLRQFVGGAGAVGGRQARRSANSLVKRSVSRQNGKTSSARIASEVFLSINWPRVSRAKSRSITTTASNNFRSCKSALPRPRRQPLSHCEPTLKNGATHPRHWPINCAPKVNSAQRERTTARPNI